LQCDSVVPGVVRRVILHLESLKCDFLRIFLVSMQLMQPDPDDNA
jgi:hypothetical protein